MLPLLKFRHALLAWLVAAVSRAADPVAPLPEHPRILAIDGRPVILRTLGEHYSAVIRADFEFVPYLDTLRDAKLNLTRTFLVGFRHNALAQTADPLAIPPALFLQPWQRATSGDTALDGLGKWDFTQWNETYFQRLEDFARACDQRGVVPEFAFFCTFYTEIQWRSSPFHPANNVQQLGPASRYDCFRPANNGLLAVQEAVVREIVRRLNRFGNLIYNVQNEPFWNEPGVRDAEEVEFHNLMLAAIRNEESQLPHQHLVGHNFPARSAQLSGFDIINEHYPADVPGSPVRGAEAHLAERYSTGKVLSLDETDSGTPAQARLESWMFILGGGAIYNGLDVANLLYTVADETGAAEPGPAMREAVGNLATYTDELHLPSLRRDLSWVVSGIPSGATLQAMASPGQQYVAYLHHGVGGVTSFQLAYDPIDASEQTATLGVELPAGAWRISWTRPADLAALHTETIAHPGGTATLQPVNYQEDVALRIDRADEGDLTPPPHPSSLRATAAADGSIELEWTQPASADLALHHIYRREDGTAEPELPAAIVSTPDLTWLDTAVAPGTGYTYFVTSVDGYGNESIRSAGAGAVPELRSAPFGGQPRQIPGFLETEDFDNGGEGIAYHDAGAGNEGSAYRPAGDVDIGTHGDPEGFHIHSIEPGEWLQYSVAVGETAVFRPEIRIRGPQGEGSWSFAFDGGAPNGAIAANAGTDWEVLSGPEVPLAAGSHQFRLTFTGSLPENRAGDLDWIRFVAVPKPPPAADAGAAIIAIDHDLDGTAQVTLDGSASAAGEAEIDRYAWSIGSTALAEGATAVVSLPHGHHAIRLIVTDAFGFTATDETSARVVAGEFGDGGFENGFDGWSFAGNVAIQQAAPYVAAGGSRLVSFNQQNLAPDGVISRSFATAPGTTYELTFDYGVLAYNNNEQTLGVEIWGDTLLRQSEHTVARLPGSNTRWRNETLHFVADGETATILFRDRSEATFSLDLTLDNVRVVAQVSRTLSVTSLPFDGAEIMLQPADAAGRNGGAAPLDRAYPNETPVTITAGAWLQGHRFEKWTRDGSDFATTASVEIVLHDDVSLAAHYVEAPPAIVSDPADATAAEGDDVTFFVQAEGTGTLVYQWRRNGADIDGATAAALVLPAVTEADEDAYHVVVSNNAGSTASAGATLTVWSAGEFSNGGFEDGFAGWTAAGNLTIQQGGLYQATEGANLAVFNNGNSVPDGVLSRVLATTPGAVYELSFDFGVLAYNNNPQKLGIEVTGVSVLLSESLSINRLPGSTIRWMSRSFFFTADGSLATLTFRDLSTFTNGLDLTLDNIRIVRQISRRLDVSSAPFDGAGVSIVPADNGGVAGGTTPVGFVYPDQTAVTLTAAPSLQGHRFEKWTRDGADLATTASVGLVLDADVSLAAHYAEGPPVILSGPADATAAEGEEVTFSVQAEGTGALIYQWSRNTVDIDGATGATLILPAVTEADEGIYHVVVSNNAGSTGSAGATLTVSSAGDFANGGLEDGFAGWEASGNLVIRQGGVYQPTEGVTLAVFNSGNSVPNGVLSRTISTTSGASYELSFDFGVLAYNNNPQSLGVEITGSGVLFSGTFTTRRLPGSIIRWESRTLSFSADANVTTLTFRDISSVTNALDLTLDNIRLAPAAQAAAFAAPAGARAMFVAPSVPPRLPGTPGIAVASGRAGISWHAGETGIHQLQRSTDLRGWETIRSLDVKEPGLVEFTDTPPPDGPVFYRIARPR